MAEPGSENPPHKVHCPHCQTTRLRVLNKLDRIETLYGNALLNRIRARRGDTIYHCVYCRLQFYDPHKPNVRAETARKSQEKQAAPEKTEPEPVRVFAAVAGVNGTARVALPLPEPPPAPLPPPSPRPVMTPIVQLPPVTPQMGTNFSAGVTVRGTIHSAEDIYVDGRIDGTMASKDHCITIGPNAKIKANVNASELVVLGTLHGNSQIASRMTLRTGSKVVGDIKTSDIVVEDGAQLKGAVELVRGQPRLPL